MRSVITASQRPSRGGAVLEILPQSGCSGRSGSEGNRRWQPRLATAAGNGDGHGDGGRGDDLRDCYISSSSGHSDDPGGSSVPSVMLAVAEAAIVGTDAGRPVTAVCRAPRIPPWPPSAAERQAGARAEGV